MSEAQHLTVKQLSDTYKNQIKSNQNNVFLKIIANLQNHSTTNMMRRSTSKPTYPNTQSRCWCKIEFLGGWLLSDPLCRVHKKLHVIKTYEYVQESISWIKENTGTSKLRVIKTYEYVQQVISWMKKIFGTMYQQQWRSSKTRWDKW